MALQRTDQCSTQLGKTLGLELYAYESCRIIFPAHCVGVERITFRLHHHLQRPCLILRTSTVPFLAFQQPAKHLQGQVVHCLHILPGLR